jgi:hypothetical protein
LETQVSLSGDLDYIKENRLNGIRLEIGEVERMLKALIKSLEQKILLEEGFTGKAWMWA